MEMIGIGEEFICIPVPSQRNMSTHQQLYGFAQHPQTAENGHGLLFKAPTSYK